MKEFLEDVIADDVAESVAEYCREPVWRAIRAAAPKPAFRDNIDERIFGALWPIFRDPVRSVQSVVLNYGREHFAENSNE
jgi:hypothetical protein